MTGSRPTAATSVPDRERAESPVRIVAGEREGHGGSGGACLPAGAVARRRKSAVVRRVVFLRPGKPPEVCSVAPVLPHSDFSNVGLIKDQQRPTERGAAPWHCAARSG